MSEIKMSTWPFGIIGEVIGHAIGPISFDIYHKFIICHLMPLQKGPAASDWFSLESGQNNK